MNADVIVEALRLIESQGYIGADPVEVEEVDLWAPRALRKALDRYNRNQCSRSWMYWSWDDRRWALREIALLLKGAVPDRGKRSMPSIARIAAHHDLPPDECWRCGRDGYVERAHIVARVWDGLDGPQNIALLCPPCHRRTPAFDPWDWQARRLYSGLPALPATDGAFPSNYRDADYTEIEWRR